MEHNNHIHYQFAKAFDQYPHQVYTKAGNTQILTGTLPEHILSGYDCFALAPNSGLYTLYNGPDAIRVSRYHYTDAEYHLQRIFIYDIGKYASFADFMNRVLSSRP